MFSWTPTEQQDGTYNMVVQVSDGDMPSAVTFPVTVSEVNEDPVLNPIGSKSVNKLEALTFTATASDVDVISRTADTLTFSLPSGPTGASITQSTGVFSWTPTAGQVGTHTITFQVEDGAGATDFEGIPVNLTTQTASDTAPPTFVSSGLDLSTGALTITFSEADRRNACNKRRPGQDTRKGVRQLHGRHNPELPASLAPLPTALRSRLPCLRPHRSDSRRTGHAGTDDRTRGGTGHV